MLTFEQFQATRWFCGDIPAHFKGSDEDWDGIPGFIYGEEGSLYIEFREVKDHTLFHLHLETEEWDSADLTELERRLYKYACDDGEGKTFDPATAPSAQQLADRFAVVLRSWLTAEEWAKVRVRNASETDPHVCHSHDFCDANMAMDEAWGSFMNAHIDADDEAQAKLWSDAWDIAKKQYLTA